MLNSVAARGQTKPSLAAQHTRPCECCPGFCRTVQHCTMPKFGTQAAVRITRKSSGRHKSLHGCKLLCSPSRLAQSAGGQRTNKPSLAARHTRPCECRPDFLGIDQACSTPKLGTRPVSALSGNSYGRFACRRSVVVFGIAGHAHQ